jgi:hypothetical protein
MPIGTLPHFSERDVYFVVYAPAYERTSGGIHALHALAEDLYAMGCTVGMLAASGMPGARTPIITPEQLFQIKSSGMLLVAIYPEIVVENTLQADYVVWWLLNFPGFIRRNWDGSHEWADRIVCFGPEVGKDCRCDGKLIYPLYDPDLFFPNPDIPKTETVYYVNRILTVAETIQKPVEPTYILDPKISLSYKQLRALFWKSKVVITHEWSGTMVIAQMCGVPVVFIESALFSPETHKGELFMYGSAWGYSTENLLAATRTLSSVAQIHKDRKAVWHHDVASELKIWIDSAKRKF